jgi:hypothetical protein
VNRFAYHVQLSQGNWGRPPTRRRVRESVSACGNRDNGFCHLSFFEPADEETRLECRVCFEAKRSHSEIIRDKLIETLSLRFQPEYDSMVEVEVIDD